jgi:hypothetical protein
VHPKQDAPKKNSVPRHTVITPARTKEKEKVLKATKGVTSFLSGGKKSIWRTADFS